jgi:Immunity protein 8
MPPALEGALLYARPVRAELKGLDADGHEVGAFRPDDPVAFSVNLSASVGPAGEEGAEQFQFTVCSPRWQAEQPLPKGFAFQRHTLLVDSWDPDVVERAISDLCRRTEGATWRDVATKLSRFGFWEFEDYRE